MNQVQISGNLGRDPELRQTGGGKSVTNLSVAVSSGYGDKKKTDWFSVVCWEKTAEFASKFLHKGSRVLISGSLQTRQWEDKEGNKKSVVEIVCRDLEALDGKPKGEPQQEDEIPF